LAGTFDDIFAGVFGATLVLPYIISFLDLFNTGVLATDFLAPFGGGLGSDLDFL
jgi:hypothetical protein